MPPTIYLDSVAHNPDGSLLASLGAFDYDGDVDDADLEQWRAEFDTASGASFDWSDADIDGADFLAWQQTYQPLATTSLSAVPEPRSSLLFVAATLFIFCSIRCPRRNASLNSIRSNC
ncbi:hypothetical protein [Bythopirellula goksoeyrii]|uniref:hypothetical protein n=1 Tax=Bythopirellula goksoeyrii TaxID=1400387 RepID=UPI0011CDCF03|nr:hypothetical protein [Bythopirellula goksoeyrii]